LAVFGGEQVEGHQVGRLAGGNAAGGEAPLQGGEVSDSVRHHHQLAVEHGAGGDLRGDRLGHVGECRG